MMELEKEIHAIHERNRMVELNKAWETSITRRLFIAIVTYAAALLFLILIEVPTPYLAALVPTGGYILSTLSLPYLRKAWEKNRDA